MNTAIVILNWNGEELLRKFLPSVLKFTPSSATIYVADNGSTDRSRTLLASDFPSVKLIDNEENLGFAEGYNRALKQVNEEFVVLLNSDVEVSEGWLEPLISKLNSSESIAACQPKIRSYANKEHFEYAGASGGMIDQLGYPFCRGRIFDHCEKDVAQYDDSIKIFWATGTCLAIRKSAYYEVGGLDADFFAHMEEIDLCWRLHRANYNIWVEPKSVIYHVGGGTLGSANPKKTFLNFRNGLSMLTKNSDLISLLWIIPVRLVLDGVAGLKFLISGQPGHTWAIIKAHFSYYFGLFKWLGKRDGAYSKLAIISHKSVVWSYFIKGRKTYSELSE